MFRCAVGIVRLLVVIDNGIPGPRFYYFRVVPLFLPAGAILRSPAAAIFHFVFVLFPWTQVLLLPCGPIAPRQQLARATAVSVL